ncbi:2,5-diamino-6-ribosylamino-4(3H)-pyrimidinone 5'-phosphate reductase [Methanimicrococcus hongohii]|uniref:2,5-diamino-6-(ribosylamino)-4(3H)-pyrimidinone 5'-phosphate reductase n=1 Tax=Methanimicrococcus hongohii TaxID=3028295 RepID=A0AA96V112_9EURY|nr:2,5-diamino-6-(ribosylamino)-4(3H)-pyrimidinone 5'-phosphate reductase [Methanimicrococcus sp. Hf6]WNY23295.1 2,5-diamino-6-ribosylamino-4(3H)-pyrimidinone 5'-phosphate reductase [Methanimicrococcus sp. Hf6]
MIPPTKRPYIFINSAMSADGKLSTFERKQVKISGKMDFDRVDELRAETDAIMVGIGTVLADDPSLTVKSEERREKRVAAGKEENPIRIIVDSKARTPLDADIFKKGKGRKIIVVSKSAAAENKEKVDAFSKMPETKVIVAGIDRVNLEEMAVQLKNEGIDRLMVEGGAALNYGLISTGIVDELKIFVGNLIIGGKTAPTFADGDGFSEEKIKRLTLESAEKIEDGILLTWKVKNED